MRTVGVFSMLAVAAMATPRLIHAQGASATPPKAVVLPAGELRWIDNPALKGAQQAVLWGDPARAAYGALKRIPAGTVLAMHTHTNETRALLVAGTLSFTVEGSAARNLGPGSYVSVPGGVPHAASCAPGPDCVYFETSNGAYDIKTR